MSNVIWKLLTMVLDLNARIYGPGSSFELCRDLKVRYCKYVWGVR